MHLPIRLTDNIPMMSFFAHSTSLFYTIFNISHLKIVSSSEMESRQSNKESALQRGGNEKGSPFVICDVFSPFSLLITGEEFQVQVSHESLLHFLLLFSPLSATPFPFVSVHLLARLLLGTQREFPSRSSSPPFSFLFSLRSDVIRFLWEPA